MQSVEQLIETIIKTEGGYVNRSDDSGGPTKYGITIATLSAYRKRACTAAEVQRMEVTEARAIYTEKYYVEPGFAQVAKIAPAIGAELTDTGVNMGQTVASTFLQRVLNALNDKGNLYSDIQVDGNIGPATITALSAFVRIRGQEGVQVILKGLNCLQGAKYISLAEARQKDEAFVYGWLNNRVEL